VRALIYLLPLGLVVLSRPVASLLGLDAGRAESLAGNLSVVVIAVSWPLLAWRDARERRGVAFVPPSAAEPRPALPLAVEHGGDGARSQRAASLFFLAILGFVALGAAASATSRSSGLAAFVAILLGFAYLLHRALRGLPTLRFDGVSLSDGRRTVGLEGHTVSFAARGLLSQALDVGELGPAVEVRSASGAVRFRPIAYEPVACARLVRALAGSAAAGDARGWLLATYPAPAPEAKSGPADAGPSGIVMAALGVLYFLIIIGGAVVAGTLSKLPG